jgi:hypothetical protein
MGEVLPNNSMRANMRIIVPLLSAIFLLPTRAVAALAEIIFSKHRGGE